MIVYGVGTLKKDAKFLHLSLVKESTEFQLDYRTLTNLRPKVGEVDVK